MRFLTFCLCLLSQSKQAEIAERDGWTVPQTQKSYTVLVDAVRVASGENSMGVVTQAGPTGAARNRGIEILGNRVIGLLNNVYAVRILNLSTAAMIEAPIRMYATENDDGTATVSYKHPSAVFAPYMNEAGPDLAVAAGELDMVFQAIATRAAQ